VADTLLMCQREPPGKVYEQVTGIAKLAFAPGIDWPTGRLLGTDTDGRFTVSGSGAVQSV